MPLPKVTFEPGRPGPLDGVRVLDFSRLVAGNMLSLQLADFGAEVVKVETPGRGDTLRDWREAGVSVHWKVYARNKKSITLNLKAPEAPGIVLDLVPHFDVLIESFRFGYLERLGVAPEVLLARNPRLVIVRVSGFGQTGPYRKRPGFGTLVEAMSGFAARNGFEDREPVLPAARHGRHDRGALRRDGDGHRGAARGARRRPRSGDRPELARLDLLDPRPRRRHPQADAARAPALRQRDRVAVAAQRVRDEGRRVGRHLRLHPGHDGAAVPRHRARRPQRRPEVQDECGADQAAR
jgi:hypothetical protein